MSLVIEATPGLPTSNSYLTLEEAQSLFATMLDRDNAGWQAQTDNTKNKLLVQATRSIDEAFNFMGYRTNDSQSLQWPRSDVPVEGIYANSSNYQLLDYTTIPMAVKQATVDMARTILVRDIHAQSPTALIAKAELGSLKVEFNDSPDVTQVPGNVISSLRKYGVYLGDTGKSDTSETFGMFSLGRV